ncbi:MAG: pyridoxine 5'-phosphate synthase [Porticoccaceae bacterium]|nr:MAG: pyridoxine 5'-phosphate synthase [Porticoccaceae bacterium]
MIRLSVNLNKIALIRNSRGGNEPSVTDFARIAIAAGAHGITVHPRPDQRHIRPSDVFELAGLIEETPGIEFNVEGNPFAGAEGTYPGFLYLVEESRPHQATLVPDAPGQLTSDHGFDLRRSGARLEPVVCRLKERGIRVSLFLDPDLEQIRLAREVGADRVELYTGPWAVAFPDPARREALFRCYEEAAQAAAEAGLGVNAGHDLNLHNLERFRALPHLLEVSIGHALTVDALRLGMARAVRAYLEVLAGGKAP